MTLLLRKMVKRFLILLLVKAKFLKNQIFDDRNKVGNNFNAGSEKKKVYFFCISGEHVSLYDCQDFKALSLSDRIKFAYENHLCYKCLKHGLMIVINRM